MKKDTVNTKYRNSPPRVKKKLDYVSKSRPKVKLPLLGKTVYLDVKEIKHVKRLQQDLKRLGGTIEEFLSKDINYLITTQPRPKKKNGNIEGNSPAPSPFNCDPSPSPGCAEDKKVPTVTRGKALAEKARVKARETNNLLDNAEKWGVRIVSLEGAYKWIEKELKKLPKPSHTVGKKPLKNNCVAKYKKFKAPFLKIEVSNFVYRPLHHELEVWPRINIDTPRGSCPFDGTLIRGGDHSKEERGELLAAQVDIPSEDTPKEEKDGVAFDSLTPKLNAEKSTKKSEQESITGSKVLTAGEIRRQKDQKRKLERKRGYCECCAVKYEDLDKHVRDDQHRNYIKDKAHYEKLDQLITAGPNSLQFISACLSKAVLLKAKKKAQHCEDEEISFIGSTPVKPLPSSAKGVSKSEKIQQVKAATETEQKSTIRPSHGKQKKTHEDYDKMSVNTGHVLKENTNCSPNKRQVKQYEVVAKDNGKERREFQKRTSPRKSVKDSSVKVSACKGDQSVKAEMFNSSNVPEKRNNTKVLSPRKSPRKCHVVQDKENESLKDTVEIAVDKRLSTQELKSLPAKASPRTGRCLSGVFEQEKKRETCQSIVNKTPKRTSGEVENKVNDISVRNIEKGTVESSPVASQSLSKSRRSRTGTEEKSKICNQEIIEDADYKLKTGDSRLAKEQECKRKQTGAAGEVKAVMDVCTSRVQTKHSSDDFEVCLLRAVTLDQLTAEHTVGQKQRNESEEREIKSLGSNEQKSYAKKGKKLDKKEQKNKSQETDNMNESKESEVKRLSLNEQTTKTKKGKAFTHTEQKNKSQKTDCKKRTNKVLKTDNIEIDAADKSSEIQDSEKPSFTSDTSPAIDISEKHEEKEIVDCSGKTQKTFDDNQVASANSFSDFQFIGPDGEVVFTKTLAERIKERSRSRPLDTSFGPSSSLNTSRQGYPLARSHSGSSMGTSTQTSSQGAKKQKKTKAAVSKKAKSQANIASKKVLSKYRSQREMTRKYESSQVGYQGDDERDGWEESNKDRRTTRKSGKLSPLKPVTGKDKTGTEVEQEQTYSKKGAKFWYYVAESTEEETVSDSDAESDKHCIDSVKYKDNKQHREHTKTAKGSKLKSYDPESTEEETDSESNSDAESDENSPDMSDQSGEVRLGWKKRSTKTVKVNSNIASLRNRTNVSYVEIDEKSDQNSEINEAAPVKKSKNSKFWHYVPEVVEEEKNSEKEVELDYISARKESAQEKKRVSKVSNSAQENENSDVNEEIKLELTSKPSEEVSVKPKKKKMESKKFWDFVPETVDVRKDSENEQTPLDRSRRQSKIAAAEKLKNTSGKDSENERTNRMCNDELSNSEQENVGSDVDEESKLVLTGKKSKEVNVKTITKKKKTKKFWDFVPETVDVRKESENEQTPLDRSRRQSKIAAAEKLKNTSQPWNDVYAKIDGKDSENDERSLSRSGRHFKEGSVKGMRNSVTYSKDSVNGGEIVPPNDEKDIESEQDHLNRSSRKCKDELSNAEQENVSSELDEESKMELTNKPSEEVSLKPKKKKMESKKFWDFVPETVDVRKDSENEQTPLDRSRRQSKIAAAEKLKNTSGKGSEKERTNRMCNDELSNSEQENVGSDVDEESKLVLTGKQSEEVNVKTKKKKKKSKKFWDFVPETVDVRKESENEQTPLDRSRRQSKIAAAEKLKNTSGKDSENDERSLSRSRGQRREDSALMRMRDSSTNLQDSVYGSDPDCHQASVNNARRKSNIKTNQYNKPETLPANAEKDTEFEHTQLYQSSRNCKDEHSNSEQENVSSELDDESKMELAGKSSEKVIVKTKKKKRKQFWVFVPETVNTGKDPESEQMVLDRSRRQSKVAAAEKLRNNDGKDPDNVRSSRKCKDEAVRRLSTMPVMADDELEASDDSSESEHEETTLTESNKHDADTEPSKQVQAEEVPAKSKLGKFWYYTVEVSNDDTNIEKEVEILPSKLRTLTSRRYCEVSDSSDTDTHHKSRQPHQALKTSDSFKKVTDVERKRCVKGEKTKQHGDDSEGGNELKACVNSVSGSGRTQKCFIEQPSQNEENKNTCQNKHNKKGQGRDDSKERNVEVISDSGKRKTECSKWWEYVTYVEPASDGSDPCIPKELQSLKSTWNDLKVESKSSKTRRHKLSLNLKSAEKKHFNTDARGMGIADKLEHKSGKGDKELEKESNSDISKCKKNVKSDGENKQKTVAAGAVHLSHRQTVRSPTFHKTNKFKQKRKEKRSASPVFQYSPPAKRKKENIALEITSCRRDPAVQSNAVISCNSGVSESTDTQTQKETSVDGENSLAKTPDNKVTVSEPKSGYSATPREKRKKMWKRKKSDLSSARVNSDGSCQDRKRRKLDKIKYIINGDSQGSSPATSEKKKLEQGFERQDTCDNIDNKTPSQFSLRWETSEVEKENSLVTLDQTWNSFSERSALFVGDKTNTIGSTNNKPNNEISQDECSDISLVNDSEDECGDDKSTRGKQSSNDEFDFGKFVPAPFSSPGKRSDSSWLDTCEDFIDKSLKKDSSLCYSYTSPWKSPMRKSKQISDRLPGLVECSTPKKQSATPRKNCDQSVEKIDQDIEFNFGSPQKNKQAFSPLRYKNGHVVDTSTPKCQKKLLTQSNFNLNCKDSSTVQFSGLTFKGDDQESSADNDRVKEFKLLKKISSNKKKYNLSYDKSPTKKGGRKKVSI